jgi:hypothetical protein
MIINRILAHSLRFWRPRPPIILGMPRIKRNEQMEAAMLFSLYEKCGQKFIP